MAETTRSSNQVSEQSSPAQRKQLFIREASCHATLIIAGWSDASSGPLIPYIQSYFGVSYTVVSMLFVGQMVGFLSAGFLNSLFSVKLGLGRVITLGAVIQMASYIFLVPAIAFPIMPICYAIGGFGMALQDAQANTYVATLPNCEAKFGYLHASYGLGALLCPLAATAFASSGIKFSYFYAISIGLAFLNVLILLYAFKFSYRIPAHMSTIAAIADPHELELDQVRATAEQDDKQEEEAVNPNDHQFPPQQILSNPAPTKSKGLLAQTLSNKSVWICCFFIFVYVGAEVAMGGWIVTFIIDNRNGGPSAGYVATGFWGGLTLGRAISTPLNLKVGENRIVYVYVFLAACLELAIWFSRNLIGNAITVAIIGILMGPIYPITMSVCTKIIPRNLHASGLGFIAAAGQTGSALFPFMTGALAQKFSPAALQPIMIALFASMAAIWTLCPVPQRKSE